MGLVLSVDRMEDQGLRHVRREGRGSRIRLPVLSIANVREIFDAAAKMKNPDGTPLLSHDIQQRRRLP